MRRTLTDFTVLMIATNKYLDFAVESIRSIQEFLFPDKEGQVLLFTDQPKSFNVKSDSRVQVDLVEIEPLKWPEATLLRYEIFNNHWQSVQGDFVIYLDADTLVKRATPFAEVNLENLINGIALVQHPGYYENTGLKWILNRTIASTWETNAKSLAFVPLLRRKKYVCGGVWMGEKNSIEKMIKQLARQVTIDRQNGVMAKWHDESHLNSWFANNKVSAKTPEWAYSPDYNYSNIENPIIEVITKSVNFERITTKIE